jgi:RNA polymerase sigma factor (sigma-70 family)
LAKEPAFKPINKTFFLEVPHFRVSKFPALDSMHINSFSGNSVGVSHAAHYQRRYAAQRIRVSQVGGLATVFMANRDALHRFLRARLRGSGDPEDVLQDIWVKLESLESGPVAEPLAYIYRMAENLVLDRRRSAIRRTNRETEWTKGQIDGSLGMAVDSQPDAERHLLARDHLRRVDGVLDSLPERTAFAFRSVRIEGVPQREIAASMGISLSAVEKHLQRAYRAVLEIQRNLDAENPAPERRGMEGPGHAS